MEFGWLSIFEGMVEEFDGLWLSIFQGMLEEFGDLIVGCELLRFLVEHKNGKVKISTADNKYGS